MDKEEFNELLRKAGISKKEFANLTNISYNTITGWGSTNKIVPNWVKPFIENYQKAKIVDDIKSKICK
jgi:ABC-type oligopeptide transport system substrate-binding subunit